MAAYWWKSKSRRKMPRKQASDAEHLERLERFSLEAGIPYTPDIGDYLDLVYHEGASKFNLNDRPDAVAQAMRLYMTPEAFRSLAERGALTEDDVAFAIVATFVIPLEQAGKGGHPLEAAVAANPNFVRAEATKLSKVVDALKHFASRFVILNVVFAINDLYGRRAFNYTAGAFLRHHFRTNPWKYKRNPAHERNRALRGIKNEQDDYFAPVIEVPSTPSRRPGVPYRKARTHESDLLDGLNDDPYVTLSAGRDYTRRAALATARKRTNVRAGYADDGRVKFGYRHRNAPTMGADELNFLIQQKWMSQDLATPTWDPRAIGPAGGPMNYPGAPEFVTGGPRAIGPDPGSSRWGDTLEDLID